MSEGKVAFIESFICLEVNNSRRVIFTCKLIGHESRVPFLPKPINGESYSVIPGMMTKYIGKGSLQAFDALDVGSKGVIASIHDLT